MKDQELAGQVPNKEEIPITEVTKEEPAIQPNQISDQKSEKPETPEKLVVSDSQKPKKPFKIPPSNPTIPTHPNSKPNESNNSFWTNVT